jgi:hypothetical protein
VARAQLETVSYACQRFEQKLPTNERAGFFLGDGVGLGKGRQLAGIVFDNWERGRKVTAAPRAHGTVLALRARGARARPHRHACTALVSRAAAVLRARCGLTG